MEVDEHKIRQRLDEIHRLDLHLRGFAEGLRWVLGEAQPGATAVVVSAPPAKVHPQRTILEIFREATEPLNIKMVIEIARTRRIDLKQKTVQAIVRKAFHRKILARVGQYRFVRAPFREAALAAMMEEELEEEE